MEAAGLQQGQFTKVPADFELRECGERPGLYLRATEKHPSLWIAAPLYVTAFARTQESRQWARMLEWRDHDAACHKKLLTNEELARDPVVILSQLDGYLCDVTRKNDLMCKAQPYLSDLPGFHVDKAKFEDILAGWAAMENMAGTVTEWRKQLELYPDIMPVRLIPNGVFNGRYTAREPSILSMPSALRTAMNAAPGHTLVAVDFHQCQPRIIAEASGDPVFRAPFVNGTDYYKMWASFLLGKPEAEVTAEERKGCKLIALMWCFGMGDDKLGDEFERLGFSKEQALRGMRRFERACGRLKQWERSLIYDAQKRRGIWTVAAAPELRRFFSIPRGSAHNAMNYLATGTEVTIMLVAIIVLGRKLEELHPTARIALYLYDEVIVQCPVEEAEAVADLTQKALLWAFRQVLPHAPTSGLLDCRIAPN